MAELRLTIGTLNAVREETNARASAVLSAYAAAIGATGTNHQKGEAVLAALVAHMIEEARRHKRHQAQQAANEALAAELAELHWGEPQPPVET